MGYKLIPIGSISSQFNPKNIPSLLCWLDFSDNSTITESSGSVIQVDDKSGNSNHASQSTGSMRPLTGTTSYNSKNTLKFGLGDSLNTPIDLDCPSNDFMIGILSSHDVVDGVFRVAVGQWGSGVGRQIAIGKNGLSNFYGGMFGAADILSTESASNHAFSLSNWDHSGAVLDFYVNNVDYGASGGAPQATVNNLYIGGAFPGSETFNGEIGEIIIARHYPSDVLIKKLWRRQKSAWGL